MLGKLGIASGNYLGPDPSVAGGSALRTRDYVTNITGSSGVIYDRIKQDGSFDRIISTYNDSISRLQTNLDTYEADLRAKFARLETNLSELQTQSTALTSAIASYTAQTSSK
jgi:flagellar capping protein FliD